MSKRPIDPKLAEFIKRSQTGGSQNFNQLMKRSNKITRPNVMRTGSRGK